MTAADSPQRGQSAACGCFERPYQNLIDHRELGMDAHFAEVTLLVCSVCGQHWLRYFFELEAFSASGRWYLGAITTEQASHLTAANAAATLEHLDWYFFGGSYFNGHSGKTSGSLHL